MDVVWDPKKVRSNRTKHRVSFPDAELVLFDPNAITIEEQWVGDEQRFVTLGMDALGRILVLVYTYRGDMIRLISARKATPREVRTYHEKGI